jgi:hypothetical protein
MAALYDLGSYMPILINENRQDLLECSDAEMNTIRDIFEYTINQLGNAQIKRETIQEAFDHFLVKNDVIESDLCSKLVTGILEYSRHIPYYQGDSRTKLIDLFSRTMCEIQSKKELQATEDVRKRLLCMKAGLKPVEESDEKECPQQDEKEEAKVSDFKNEEADKELAELEASILAEEACHTPEKTSNLPSPVADTARSPTPVPSPVQEENRSPTPEQTENPASPTEGTTRSPSPDQNSKTPEFGGDSDETSHQ